MIESASISPAMRKRYYWTNIKGVVPPIEKEISL